MTRAGTTYAYMIHSVKRHNINKLPHLPHYKIEREALNKVAYTQSVNYQIKRRRTHFHGVIAAHLTRASSKFSILYEI